MPNVQFHFVASLKSGFLQYFLSYKVLEMNTKLMTEESSPGISISLQDISSVSLHHSFPLALPTSFSLASYRHRDDKEHCRTLA